MNVKRIFPLILAVFSATSGHSGFVSTNDMGAPIGIICQINEQTQLQVKLAYGRYILRQVTQQGRDMQVENFATMLECRESRYPDEPTMENTCVRNDESGLETARLQVIPYRQMVHILLHQTHRHPENRWWRFATEQCRIEQDQLILPPFVYNL